MLFKQTKKKELNAPTIGQAHRIKRGKTNEHNRNCADKFRCRVNYQFKADERGQKETKAW